VIYDYVNGGVVTIPLNDLFARVLRNRLRCGGSVGCGLQSGFNLQPYQ
jgi:hypothetical protein